MEKKGIYFGLVQQQEKQKLEEEKSEEKSNQTRASG